MSYYHEAEKLRSAVTSVLPPEEYVCLLTSQQQIARIDEAWRSFARENGHEPGPHPVGWNLMQVCGTPDLEPGAELSTAQAFDQRIELQYPLTDTQQDGPWFKLLIIPWADTKRQTLTIYTSVMKQPSLL